MLGYMKQLSYQAYIAPEVPLGLCSSKREVSFVTDAEKLFSIMCFLMNEGLHVDDQYRVTLSYRTARWRECDQLDLLEFIQLQDRVQHFNEISAVLSNMLYGTQYARPSFYPLTGLRYDATM